MSRSRYRPQQLSTPGWWNRVFNNIPKKREAQRLAREAVKGADLDALMWPADKKPHQYYW